MFATHNIKVNGRWVKAGEEYSAEKPDKVRKAQEPEEVNPETDEPKTDPKPRTTTRRKSGK